MPLRLVCVALETPANDPTDLHPADEPITELLVSPAEDLPAALYAIGDVHGCLEQLQCLLDLIAADTASLGVPAPVVIPIGDLIDRGPDSRGALLRVLACDVGLRLSPILGNHEIMMLEFVDHPTIRRLLGWLGDGGLETLRSFGINAHEFLKDARLPKSALQRLAATMREVIGAGVLHQIRSWPVMRRYGQFVFVHAGLRPGLPLTAQTPDDMLWIRDEFLSYGRAVIPNTVIVHGHTPVPQPAKLSYRINLDTGCVFGGQLTAVRLHPGPLQFFRVE